jgi:hypothetical protein
MPSPHRRRGPQPAPAALTREQAFGIMLLELSELMDAGAFGPEFAGGPPVAIRPAVLAEKAGRERFRKAATRRRGAR